MSSKNKKSGSGKSFGMGIAGGLVGALLVVGGNYAINGNNTSEPATTTQSSTKGDTKVSNVTYNVGSGVVDAVKKVQPAVVSVINLQKPQAQSNDPFGIFGSESEEGEDSSSDELQPASEGSGLIYKKDGNTAYVVTNNHVVEGQKGLEILLADGTKVTGKLVGADAYSDLAVIKIDAKDVKETAKFGDSSKLQVGEPAIAIGSPLGSQFANSVTEGIVSSLNRVVTIKNQEGKEININTIQTDAAINPGNSGGPLIDINGQVIGINSSKIAGSGSGSSIEGIGFAIPSNDVVNIINQLEKDGSVQRPALGVSTVDLSGLSTQQIKEILKVPTTVKAGAVLAKVQAATPADQAGLKQYDVITKIDDDEVTSSTGLQSALYKHKVGDTIKITFWHQDKEKTVDVKLSIDTKALTDK
ncbi:MAG: trypsin-like peptidase domain-containing protein [Lactobacillales bacterium]|jgi:serine protease Do|nr:trypsin-like peptidase domain-containing protein [Lactobacillales bacterium]